MKKIVPLFLITLVSFTIFISCENKEPIKCYLNSTTVSSNSPVISGGSILLSTPYYSDLGNVIYEWTGPNNFVSNVQNPIIPNTTLSMAGEYSLKIKVGICETEVMKTNVEVIQNTVLCTQPNNTASFTGGNPTANFYNFSSNVVTNGKYEIKASDNNWRITVVFLADTTPISGIYSITNLNNTLSANTVQVTATRLISGSSFDFNAKTGDISLSYVSGKAVVKFCSVPFSLNNQNSTDFNCTTQFTQN